MYSANADKDIKEPLLTQRKESAYRTIQENEAEKLPKNLARTFPAADQVHLYSRRWYVLFVFCLLGLWQNLVWNTFSPIAKPAERVFHWKDANIAMLANWGPIAYVLMFLPLAWLMDVKGLRVANLTSALLVLSGTGLRCITFEPLPATWLINAGHFLNGVAGPIVMSAPPLLSALWFPPNQRTTATALATQIPILGFAGSFLIGPYIVPDVGKHLNVSATTPATPAFHSFFVLGSEENGPSNSTNIDFERNRMKILMFTEFGVAALFALLVFIYFPSKPPTPPSKSAGIERLDFTAGFKQLSRNGQFVMLVVTFGISNGVFNAWASMIDVILGPIGVSQESVGWIGFSILLVGPVSAIAIARLVDILGLRLKKVVIVLFVFSTASFVWIFLLCQSFIPFSLWMAYMSAMLGSVWISSSLSLFYEMCVETSYPTAEGITTAVLTSQSNLISLLFFLIPLIPNIGHAWMNYALVASALICLPVLCVIRERYGRTAIDTDQQQEHVTTS